MTSVKSTAEPEMLTTKCKPWTELSRRLGFGKPRVRVAKAVGVPGGNMPERMGVWKMTLTV